MNTIKTAGIIAEYNPFHNGHHYQIEEVRRQTGADYVIAVMSGDFVQRGEPAIFDKYTRTHMALRGGVDLVVELPALFATSSAEDFAACGVALLEKLGADLLCFGSESGNLELLQKAADILAAEPEGWNSLLQKHLKQGESYPAARSLALAEYTGDPALSYLLSSPNNILAVEYLKALKKRNSPMQAVTIQRRGAGYHDTALCPKANVSETQAFFASASALRAQISEQQPGKAGIQAIKPSVPVQSAVLLQNHDTADHALSTVLAAQMPPAVLEALLAEGALAAPLFADDLTELLNYRLLSAMQTQENLSCFSDLSPELAARLTKQALQFAPFCERIAQLKTKGYTYTRVSRALLHLILGITTKQITQAKALDFAPYARILGFKKSAGPLLSHLREKSRIPLITKTADARNILSPKAMALLETDFYASHVYQSLLASKGRIIRNEYTKSVIVL